MNGGDVKGLVPAGGEWLAVYAREGRLRRVRGARPGRVSIGARDFGTEPVLFWIWTEKGDVASFVGVVSFGANLIVATDPYLLGYARKGENLRKKFGRALKDLKKAERAGGYPEAERDRIMNRLRGKIAAARPANDNGSPTAPETFTCAACEKGFSPDGEACDVCGGAGVLPSVPVIEDRTGKAN